MHTETDKRGTPWGFRNPVHALVLAVSTCAGIGLCLALAVPFLQSFTWAFTLAILFFPLHSRLETRLRSRNLAALLIVLLAALVVVLPLALVARQLVVQAASGIALVGGKLDSGGLEIMFNRFPRAVKAVQWGADQVNIKDAVNSTGSWLTQAGSTVLQGSIRQALQLALTFYLLFYIVRDRRQVLGALRAFSPLSAREMTVLLRRIANTVYATIYGTLIVAAVQGFLGGLMFWWLGLSGALFWGLVMALLAVVPVLGAFVVWIPAAVILLLGGAWWKALILIAWGSLVVSTIDNFLGPILVGRKLRLHTVNIFVSLVGGLLLFGTPGLVLGPVILAATLELLAIWKSRTGEPGATPGNAPP